MQVEFQEYRYMLRPNDGQERRTNVGKVATGLSMSLDGFIAGPNDGPERPLGEGGWLKALQLAEYASRKP
jgi:hypothetical protein